MNIMVPRIFRAVLLLAVRSIILAPYMRRRCLLVTQCMARAPVPLCLMLRVSSMVCSSPVLAGGMLLSLLRAASLTRRPGMFLPAGVLPSPLSGLVGNFRWVPARWSLMNLMSFRSTGRRFTPRLLWPRPAPARWARELIGED